VNGVVVNLIEVESLPPPPEWKDWGLYQGELVECPEEEPGALTGVSIGWFYADGEFTAPPEPEVDDPDAT